MQVTRPPRPAVLFQLIVIQFILCTITLSAQDLILPDLILIRQARTDIPLPDEYTDVSGVWHPALPDYRRQYPLLLPVSSGPEIVLPGNSFPELTPLYEEVTADNNLYRKAGEKPFNHHAAGLKADIRESVELRFEYGTRDYGIIGGRIQVPVVSGGPKAWSGEISWDRPGRFYSDSGVGIQKSESLNPFASLRMGWEPGAGRPDSYRLELHEFGAENPGFSGLGGTELEFRPIGSQWVFISVLDGSGWYSSNGSGGRLRAALAAGVQLPSPVLMIKAGFDGALGSTGDFNFAPYLSINWLPDAGMSFYADAGLTTGYPESVDNTFSGEYNNRFFPETPVSSRYRIGFHKAGTGNSEYQAEFSYSYGLFAVGGNDSVTTEADKRISGTASYGYRFRSGKILISGNLDYSTQGNPGKWFAGAEFLRKILAFRLSAGSEDAILGSDLAGVRGEQPIIGLGTDWAVSDNWDAGIFLYAAVPWDRPSAKISIDWSR